MRTFSNRTEYPELTDPRRMFWSLWCVCFVVLRGWGSGRVRAWCSASVRGLLQCTHARQVLRIQFNHGRRCGISLMAGSCTQQILPQCFCSTLGTLLAIPNYRLSLENLRQLRAILGQSLGRPPGTTVEPSSVHLESISSCCTLPSDDRAARKVGTQQRVANLRVFPCTSHGFIGSQRSFWGQLGAT